MFLGGGGRGPEKKRKNEKKNGDPRPVPPTGRAGALRATSQREPKTGRWTFYPATNPMAPAGDCFRGGGGKKDCDDGTAGQAPVKTQEGSRNHRL